MRALSLPPAARPSAAPHGHPGGPRRTGAASRTLQGVTHLGRHLGRLPGERGPAFLCPPLHVLYRDTGAGAGALHLQDEGDQAVYEVRAARTRPPTMC